MGKQKRSGSAIPIEIVPRHVHLSQKDFIKLFGADHEEVPLRSRSLRGQFVSRDTVDVVGPEGVLERVRVLGPCRLATQVELSVLEAISIGTKPVSRVSGDLMGSGVCTLVGPAGKVALRRGVIVPLPHLHLNETDAASRGLRNGQEVQIALKQAAELSIPRVIVRVHPTFQSILHLTGEEASRLWLEPESVGYILA